MSCIEFAMRATATSKRKFITQSLDQLSTLKTMGLNTTETAGNKNKSIAMSLDSVSLSLIILRPNLLL